MGERTEAAAPPAGRATRTLVVLVVIWLVGTSVLLAASLAVGFDLSGVALPDGRVRVATWFLVAAVGCGLGVPAIGTLVALNAERYGPVVAFLAAGVLALGAGFGTGVLTPDGVRSIYHTVAPDAASNPDPDPDPTPTGVRCVEYSGGDTRCPGG